VVHRVSESALRVSKKPLMKLLKKLSKDLISLYILTLFHWVPFFLLKNILMSSRRPLYATN